MIMTDVHLMEKSAMHSKANPELPTAGLVDDDEYDDCGTVGFGAVDSDQCSFSLLDSDDDLMLLNDETDVDRSGSRTGPDCANMSSSLTDAIVSSPSSSQSIEDHSFNRTSEPVPHSVRSTHVKNDRRTAKQLTERKRRDRINALLDTLRTLILKLLRKNPRHHRKLEKADILELVVSFLKRELQKSKHQTDPNHESKSISNNELKLTSVTTVPQMKSPTTGIPIIPEAFVSSPCFPVNYHPGPYDPYMPNFSIPMSPLPAPPYLFTSDPVPNPMSCPNGCPSGFYQFKSGTDVPSTVPESVVPTNTVTNRRPLGSIENVKRNTGFPTPTHSFVAQARSPTKDKIKQQQQQPKSFGPSYTRTISATSIPTNPCSKLSELTYKTYLINDENHSKHSHLQAALNATTSSQALWRPYV